MRGTPVSSAIGRRLIPGDGQSQRLAAREGRLDYLLVGSPSWGSPSWGSPSWGLPSWGLPSWGLRGVSKPPAAETRLGRRTALTFPLLPPPQKNWSPPSDSTPTRPPRAASRAPPGPLPFADQRAPNRSRHPPGAVPELAVYPGDPV